MRRYLAHLIDGLVHIAAGAVPFLLLAKHYTFDRLPDRLALVNEDALDRVDTFSNQGDRVIRIDDHLYVLERQELVIIAAIAIGVTLLFQVLIQGRAGWTIGKALTGIRTVNGDGERPGIFRALIRTIVLVLDVIPSYVFPLLGGIFVLASSDNRRLGDFAAGTYVVRRSDVGDDPTGEGPVDEPAAWGTLDEHPGHVTRLSEGEPLRVGDAGAGAEDDPLSAPSPAAAAATKAPAYQPQWDPARQAYLQWDPRKQQWLQFDDDAGEWRAIG